MDKAEINNGLVLEPGDVRYIRYLQYQYESDPTEYSPDDEIYRHSLGELLLDSSSYLNASTLSWAYRSEEQEIAARLSGEAPYAFHPIIEKLSAYTSELEKDLRVEKSVYRKKCEQIRKKLAQDRKQLLLQANETPVADCPAED